MKIGKVRVVKEIFGGIMNDKRTFLVKGRKESLFFISNKEKEEVLEIEV
nr:hypothetical protein [uncultured archaeon]